MRRISATKRGHSEVTVGQPAPDTLPDVDCITHGVLMITTMHELNSVRDECYNLVKQRAKISAGTSAIPALAFDVAADVAILLELVPAVNKRFGLSKEQIAGYDAPLRQLIASNRSGGGFSMVGTEVTKTLILYALKKIATRAAVKQVLKFVPFLGWAANAFIGFRAMKFVGDTHVDDCYAVAAKMITANP